MGSAQIGITTILNGRVIQKVALVKDRILVGRSAECDVRIDHAGVSRSHAAITSNDGSVFVEDLDSSNGTLLNGKRTRRAELHNGDIVQIGGFSLHVGFTECPSGSIETRMIHARDERTVSMSTKAPATPTARVGLTPNPSAAS
jgi:pSer/pThr/pTyr-binding forkhead associated (FHA) protein